MESLDNILSGRSETASEQTAIEENVTQAVPDAEGQAEQQTEADQEEGQQQGQKTVPHEALHAEKQKVKRYTEEVSSLRQEIADRDAAWERRIAQLVEAQKPKAEPQVPDQYEDFQGATRHAVKPEIDSMRQVLLGNMQIIAGIKYGEDKVAEAETAFQEAYQSGRIDPGDVQKILGSANVYAATVQWHQRRQAQAEIGDDPAAYRAKLEAELREKITAELQSGQQQRTQPALDLPSNLAGARNVGARSGPAWSGPTPLADIFAR